MTSSSVPYSAKGNVDVRLHRTDDHHDRTNKTTMAVYVAG